MNIKVVEIRDEATHIAAMAIRMVGDNPIQRYYIHERCGHPTDGMSIMLMQIDDGLATNDPYEWPRLSGARTLPIAHNFIIENFDSISDGDVIDVQFILGETSSKKISERF